MFLSVVALAKSKSKVILVRMLSEAGTGYSFNMKRSRLSEKLTLLHYDPRDACVVHGWSEVAMALGGVLGCGYVTFWREGLGPFPKLQEGPQESAPGAPQS